MVDQAARSRTAITLVVLAVVLVAAVGWGWSQVTASLPPLRGSGPCTDQQVAAGETVSTDQVMVSVLNASQRGGLARETMDGLIGRGFAEGGLANARPAAEPGAAAVWAAPDDPAARLVASHLRGKVNFLDQSSSYPGITVVLGKKFQGLKKGRQQVKARSGATVCVPN